MADPFVSGWTPEIAAQGEARFLASGRRFEAPPRFDADDRPLPKAFSLSGFLLWAYNQGQVGSCFANMMAHILQLMMSGAAANGAERKLFNPSRRLIWYRCRQLDGSLGGRGDGGSIVNSFEACGDPPHGIGDCDEESWPYKADHNWLEMTPPAEVIKKAGDTRIEHIADMPYEPAAWKRAIFNRSPIGIGIWWPGANGGAGWDQGLIDKYGRTTGIEGGAYGHAITVEGWVEDWDGNLYWQILNSHGPIYPLPPEEIRSQIVGYKPTSGDKCFSFWAREDHLKKLVTGTNGEHRVAAGVGGFVPRLDNIPSMLDTFPV